MSEIGKIVSSKLDLGAILNSIIKTVAVGLKSEVASLMLLDEEAGELRVESSYGLPYEIVRNVRLKLDGESISCWVARTGDPVMLSGEVKDDRFKVASRASKQGVCVCFSYDSEDEEIKGLFSRSRISSILCCPFKSKTDTLGSLLVFREFPENKFTKDERACHQGFSDYRGTETAEPEQAAGTRRNWWEKERLS